MASPSKGRGSGRLGGIVSKSGFATPAPSTGRPSSGAQSQATPTPQPQVQAQPEKAGPDFRTSPGAEAAREAIIAQATPAQVQAATQPTKPGQGLAGVTTKQVIEAEALQTRKKTPGFEQLSQQQKAAVIAQQTSSEELRAAAQKIQERTQARQPTTTQQHSAQPTQAEPPSRIIQAQQQELAERPITHIKDAQGKTIPVHKTPPKFTNPFVKGTTTQKTPPGFQPDIIGIIRERIELEKQKKQATQAQKNFIEGLRGGLRGIVSVGVTDQPKEQQPEAHRTDSFRNTHTLIQQALLPFKSIAKATGLTSQEGVIIGETVRRASEGELPFFKKQDVILKEVQESLLSDLKSQKAGLATRTFIGGFVAGGFFEGLRTFTNPLRFFSGLAKSITHPIQTVKSFASPEGIGSLAFSVFSGKVSGSVVVGVREAGLAAGARRFAREIPAEQVIAVEALSDRFPLVKRLDTPEGTVKGVVKEFRATQEVFNLPEGEQRLTTLLTASPEPLKGKEIGTGLRPGEATGLFTTPAQRGASGRFLRIDSEPKSILESIQDVLKGNIEIRVLPKVPKPTITKVGVREVSRLPRDILQSDIERVQQFLEKEAPKGMAFITPKLEAGAGVKTGSKIAGSEIEATVVPGSPIRPVKMKTFVQRALGFEEFTTFKGKTVPIRKVSSVPEQGVPQSFLDELGAQEELEIIRRGAEDFESLSDPKLNIEISSFRPPVVRIQESSLFTEPVRVSKTSRFEKPSTTSRLRETPSTSSSSDLRSQIRSSLHNSLQELKTSLASSRSSRTTSSTRPTPSVPSSSASRMFNFESLRPQPSTTRQLTSTLPPSRPSQLPRRTPSRISGGSSLFLPPTPDLFGLPKERLLPLNLLDLPPAEEEEMQKIFGGGKYAPTLSAALLGIRGDVSKKVRAGRGNITGFEIRPLPSKFEFYRPSKTIKRLFK